MNNHFFIDLFEKQLSEFTGAPYVVLTDSCTNAIFLSLVHFGAAWNRVSIPRRTYISVPQAIIHAGCKLSFTNEEWVGSYRLSGTSIIDAAVGFTRGMYDGGAVCLSFQQKKTIPIGKGGAILLDDKNDYTKLKRMAWDGRDASKSVEEDLENIIMGYHMNMTPDDAARGVLLMNQYEGGGRIGSYGDYPDVSGVFV